MANKVKAIELDGDLDLFGDDSVEIHRAVRIARQPDHGRTPAEDGTVVLTSDLVYLQENLDKDILPSVGVSIVHRACSMPTRG